ncbi:DUF5700 domain-containing putative Zn-dependent protease [Pontibacter vulgaris]|uniref:DUF5700 domain-containing putative Zn-dependent protease n=1 Tax=Pontibacter vulgaris TaxID=2905679 RepID=UPI001FA7EFDC|nr:DUF5700 domain-containing putative Zn-dependent protease [Pontibacter vulgaris]
MKKLFTLILLFTASHCMMAQTIDGAAVVRYFELTDSLKQGKSISPTTWKAFLNMEGNRLYIKNMAHTDAFLERYRKTMEIVYMPKNDSILQKRLQNSQQNYLTYTIHQYKANEHALRQYFAGITSDKQAYLAAMYEKCFTMLPKKLQNQKPETTIYFIALDNDAVAQSGNLILNLWGSYNFDKIKPGILAGHEIHHLLWEPKKYDVAEKDKSLFYMLNLLMNEGAPDLIDKKLTSSPGMPEEMKFGEYMLQAGQKALPMVDEAIRNISAGNKNYSNNEIRQQVTSMSGHIPGFYMADIIERNGLREKLVKNIQNPFQFIYLYNKAAKKDKTKPFVFSDQAIAYLKKVEAAASQHKN